MVKNDVFSMVGGPGGDFCKDIYEPKLFGCIVEVFCVVNANTDLKMSISPMCRVGNVYVHRVKRVVYTLIFDPKHRFGIIYLRNGWEP